jgi:sec-independent protein translocase protein TatB
MFDFAWSEIALIAAVALIAIGPKDMPVAIRTVTSMIKKARRMASEFQTHVDEMMREANLDEVRNNINDLKNFNIRGEIEKAVDPDGSLRTTFASNPLDPTPTQVVEPLPEVTVPDKAEAAHAVLVEGPEAQPAAAEAPADAGPQAPAFVPPNLLPKPEARPIVQAAPEAPAFIPPTVVLQQRSPPPP